MAADCDDGDACTADACDGGMCGHAAIANCPATHENDCGDGVDNDGDGLVDCADPDCATAPRCAPRPAPHEVCGNCIDDDGDGLTDFEDPDCCASAESFAMSVSRSALRPRGATTRLLLHSRLAQTGLADVNPLREDVFVQIRAADGPELLCARVPAGKFMQMRHKFMFWDHAHSVASAKGLDDLSVKVRKDGSVRLRTHGRRVQMDRPTAGRLRLTVGFLDPAGDAQNRCSSSVEAFRSGSRGRLLAP